MVWEIEVHHWHCTSTRYNAYSRAVASTDKEDGAPYRREQETPGGNEPIWEKHLEGPTRARPCRVQFIGPGTSEGGSVQIVGSCNRAAIEEIRSAGSSIRTTVEENRAAGRCVRTTEKCFQPVGKEKPAAEKLNQSEHRYDYRRIYFVFGWTTIF